MEKNNKRYKLKIYYEGKEEVLFTDSLIEIDKFTTCFRDKKELVLSLCPDASDDYSFYIETQKGKKLGILYNNLRGVVFHSEDPLYQKELISLADNDNVIKSVVNDTFNEIAPTDELKDEYLNKDEILITRLVKCVNNSIEDKKSIKNLMAEFNKKYKDYRLMYRYAVPIGNFSESINKDVDLIKNVEIDRKRLSDLRNRLRTLFYGEEVEEENESEEEFDIDIDRELRYFDNSPELKYEDSILDSKNMTEEEKEEELQQRVYEIEDREKLNEYLGRVRKQG